MSFNPEDFVASLLSQVDALPPDISIDDREIPLAKNCIEFCHSRDFIGNMIPDKLFPRQIEILVKLNAEYCPHCTDMEYFGDIKTPSKIIVNDFVTNVLSHIQLLDYGKCPKCGARKSELYKNGELYTPTEYVACMGQRCVTGDTLIPTNFGTFSFKELASYQDNSEGFSPYKTKIRLITDRKLVLLPSHFYKKENEDIYEVKTKCGFSIKGTPEHPLYTKDGFIKIKDLKTKQIIPIYYNSDIFGNNHEWTTKHRPFVSFSKFRANARKAFKALRQTKLLKKITYTGIKPDADLCKMLGFWVAEGCKNANIVNTDKEVLDFCEKQLKRLIVQKDLIIRTQNSVGSRLLGICVYLNEILEGKIKAGSSGKRIPSWIFKCNKKMQAAFLQGLFEGDGGTEKNQSITYYSKSAGLIDDLKNMLLNFGIITKTYSRYKWATNGSSKQKPCLVHILNINGKFLEIFQKEINFFSDYKKERLTRCVDFYKKRQKNFSYWYDKFPHCIKEEFFDLLKDMVADIKDVTIYNFYTQGLVCGTLHHLIFFDSFEKAIRDDVELTRNNLTFMYNKIKSSSKYVHLSLASKTKLEAFYLKYMEEGILWDEVASIEYKGKDTVYDVTIPEHHCFLGNGFLNHNSGKSAISSIQLAYIIHRFLKTPNLQKVYKLLPSSPFTIPLVGLSFEKAKELLYNALYKYVTEGNWFIQYAEFLDKESSRMGCQPLYVIKDTFMRFRHKNILIAPFGPDKRKLRGNTSISSATDEVGWFLKGGIEGIKFDADEIYASVNNSLMTAKESYLRLLSEGYDNLPVPMNINISSPSSKKDKICRLYEDSKHDDYMFGMHLATWEVNPYLPFDGPTMQALLKKHGKNFWRDFGAVPPNSSNAFINDIKLLENCASKRNNICNLEQYSEVVGSKNYTTARISTVIRDNNVANRILALDAGVTHNSFAFAIASLQGKKVIFDLLTEVIPSPDAPINYSSVFNNIILKLIEQYNIKMICTDRWQNIKLLSDIENNVNLNCETKTKSVNYGDFEFFKTSLIDNNIVLPKPEIPFDKIENFATSDYPECYIHYPLAHFYLQALTVVDMQGKTVAKGDGLTDDIFRSAVLAHAVITDNKYCDIFNAPVNVLPKISNRGLCAGADGNVIGSCNIGANPNGAFSGNFSIGALPIR